MGLKIGALARATGTTPETIRYYERTGLLPKPARTDGNYRDFSAEHLRRLSFIRHARGLGFDIADIRSLAALADDPDQDCAQADRIASGHLDAVERKIEQLARLRNELRHMVAQCRGGSVATCRILHVLSDHDLCTEEHS
ncbi:MAG TPA: helix-turn-helix domain-containing protein [Allosphingosinicella sp.]|jgi:Cu(I)-responsive transcriptional regulator|nr:helix-turn-helix domain-containing protein [Allosphingosinicella sp.]